jgi:hypothetical protein
MSMMDWIANSKREEMKDGIETCGETCAGSLDPRIESYKKASLDNVPFTQI